MALLQQPPARRVLVAGATGYLGRAVVRALKAVPAISADSGGAQQDGPIFVRALVRGGESHVDASTRAMVDEVFEGEATDPATLAGLCDGIDYVISCLGVRSAKRTPTFWDVDFQGTVNILNVAVEAGVKHFFYVSVAGGDQPNVREQVPLVEAKERVTDALKDLARYGTSPMNFTVFRPGPYFNDMTQLYELVAANSCYIPGDGTTKVAPIHGDDFASHIVDAVCKTAEGSQVPREETVSGPDVYTFLELFELAHKIHSGGSGAVLETTKIPLGVIKAGGKMVSLLSPNVSTLLLMMASLASSDYSLGTRVGSRKLEDHWREARLGKRSSTFESLTEVIVHSGSFFAYDVVVAEEDAGKVRIVWEFQTRGKDIGFGVLLGQEVKIPLRRVDSHLSAQKGSLVCEKPGTYVLRWDNTYSHWNKKFLLYRVDQDDKVDEPPIGGTEQGAEESGAAATGVIVDDDGDDGAQESGNLSEAPAAAAPEAPVDTPVQEAPTVPEDANLSVEGGKEEENTVQAPLADAPAPVAPSEGGADDAADPEDDETGNPFA